MELKGECLCKTVRFHIKAESVKGFYFCHCTRCQKSTGSAHCSNLFLKNGELFWDQGEALCTDYKHQDSRFMKRFCSRCASPLPFLLDEKNKVLQVPAGSLDDDQDFEPTAHIFTDSRKSWEEKLAQTQQFAAYPE